MQDSVRLSDGSVVEINEKYQKTWRKFQQNALFVAVLVELFPFMVAALHETMYYSFMDDNAKRQLIERCIAAKMIHSRFGEIPSSFLDDAMLFDKEYILYRDSNGEMDFICEWMTAPEMLKFKVSDDACATIWTLLEDLVLISKDQIPEQQKPDSGPDLLVDNTPELVDPEAPLCSYNLTATKCTIEHCDVCSYLDSDLPKDGQSVPYSASGYCQVLKYPETRCLSVFSAVIAHRKLLYAGSSFTNICNTRFRGLPPPYRWFVDNPDDHWEDYYDSFS